MKIKTSELTGRALDYAVAMAQGWEKMAGYNGYSTPNG
ncbi:phage protein NinX family protein, partial [Xenorhabdus yunnanensis]